MKRRPTVFATRDLPGSALERLARDFLTRNTAVFRVDPGELRLDREASGLLGRDHRVVVFRRRTTSCCLRIEKISTTNWRV